MYVKNAWYVAAWRGELPNDGVLGTTLLDTRVVLYRKADAGVVAMEDRCPHRHAPLSLGRREGDALRCMYHGLKFGPDGQCLEVPGQDQVPAKACVTTFPALEAGPWIWLWMGGPALADPALLPPGLIAPDDEAWVLGQGEIAYEAHYQLINDNLLDLGHLSFVHEKTLGRGSLQWGQTRPATQRLERGVRVQRWLVDHPVPAHLGLPPGTRMDQWSSYDFLVPGVFMIRGAYHPLGSARACDRQPPVGEPLHLNVSHQAVTPVTATTSMYRFTFGHRRRDSAPGRLAIQEQSTLAAFAEDKRMIEAQQRVITGTRNLPPMVLTSADLAATQFRRLMESLAAQERA